MGIEQWYFTPWKRSKETIEVYPEIKGKYCDIKTKKQHKKPTARRNIWIPKDPDAENKASTLGKELASSWQNVSFPHSSRSRSFYTETEQDILQQLNPSAHFEA
jgi:hypothetical protein